MVSGWPFLSLHVIHLNYSRYRVQYLASGDLGSDSDSISYKRGTLEQCTNVSWEKETRDRIKVLKDGTGRLKTSWVKSPVPQSHITFTECLGKQKVSVVLQWSHQPPVSPVTSPILLVTLNHLCYFLVHRPAYALGKHLRVYTSSVLNLCWPGIPRSSLCFSLA